MYMNIYFIEMCNFFFKICYFVYTHISKINVEVLFWPSSKVPALMK